MPFPIASRRLPPLNDLRSLEDRRTWHPGIYRPPLVVGSKRRVLVGRTVRGARSSPSFLSSKLRFEAPRRVLVCIRRQRRREVLFASQRAGKSGLGRFKRRRRSEFSDISCKRR